LAELPNKIRFGGYVSERSPTFVLQNLLINRFGFVPIVVVKKPIADAVGNCVVRDVVELRVGERFKRELAFVKEAELMVGHIIDDIHVGVDRLKKLYRIVLPA
jgi:hypothetical protein